MYRLSDTQQCAVLGFELDDDRLAKRRVRNAIREDDPPALRCSLAGPREGDVDDFVLAKSSRIALPEDGKRSRAGVRAENPVAPPRRIFRTAQRNEQNGAEKNPRRVERYCLST